LGRNQTGIRSITALPTLLCLPTELTQWKSSFLSFLWIGGDDGAAFDLQHAQVDKQYLTQLCLPSSFMHRISSIFTAFALFVTPGSAVASSVPTRVLVPAPSERDEKSLQLRMLLLSTRRASNCACCCCFSRSWREGRAPTAWHQLYAGGCIFVCWIVIVVVVPTFAKDAG